MAMSDGTKSVLKFLQGNDGVTAEDIVKGTGLSMRQVTGGINRGLIAHKNPDTKAEEPLAYRQEEKIEGGVIKYIFLTDAGKAFDTED